MLDVRASRRAFAEEMRDNERDRRRRRRSEQLALSRAADVPRCASTPIRGDAGPMPTLARGSMPSLAIGSVRKKLGPARFALSDGARAGIASTRGAGGAELKDDRWLAASVAHVRELARKTVAKTVAPKSRTLLSRDHAISSRKSRRCRRDDLPTAKEMLPINRLHAASPDEDAKQRRRQWTADLQEQVRDQRKMLSKLKVDRTLREDKLSTLAEKLAVADAADAQTAELVPEADKKLIVVRARFDETVRETTEMSRYAGTLALMHGRAKEALHDAKVRTNRLQSALATLSDEVMHTKSLLLTLEAAKESAARQKATTAKRLADSSAANSEKTLALQDRVAVIDPHAVDEVELQVQAVRESKRKQRQARKEAKAAQEKAKQEQAAATLALTAARRNDLERAIRRIHARTGIDEPDALLEKFLADRDSSNKAQRKASTAKLRVESLREELQAVLEEESKAFLAYNPDTERLASRAKALRPRTSTLKLAEVNLSRCRDRAKTLKENLLVSASQIFALLQKACAAIGCDQPSQHECVSEGSGVVYLDALETLLLQLVPKVNVPETPPNEGSENAVGNSDDDSDEFSDVQQLNEFDVSDYGRLELYAMLSNSQGGSLSANDEIFLPAI